ncbi:MAG: hypothetical protein KGD64_00260 [Candidatus Heimdallarchaeota archaeon]|nr:hypothetical protein [Candidatus Heimdallarchaeota archaeon]
MNESDLIEHLTKTYPLQSAVNADEFFTKPVKKVVQHENILQLNLENGKQSYALCYLLSSIVLDSQTFPKRFTNFIIDLIRADIFSVVISSIPLKSKVLQNQPRWGLLLLAQDDNRSLVVKKEKLFHRFLNTNSTKLNCKLSLITKKDFVRHRTNFRYLVPWQYINGDFTDKVEIKKLFGIEISSIVPPTDHYTQATNEIQQEALQKKPESAESRLVRPPFPSVKTPLPNSQEPVYASSKLEIKSTKPKKKRKTYLISNLNDIAIPVPKAMNVVFDIEYLKVRINKMFKDFEFKETVIFEDNFDLVLRKDSFYIFVKFYKEILNQTDANRVIENLSSIAGLRNQFLCIVVADTIEENSMKILNEFNVLHLTLNDVLLEDTLKSKIYNTILT